MVYLGGMVGNTGGGGQAAMQDATPSRLPLNELELYSLGALWAERSVPSSQPTGGVREPGIVQ